MKKLLSILVLSLLFSGSANSKDIRTVERANIDEAWQVDGKFIKPECFDYIMVSGDRYQAFYDEYFGKPNGSHWDDANFLKFVDNVGDYLNKEVPLNHSIDGWGDNKKLSLTKQLDGCLSELPETAIRFSDESGRSSSTVEYKVQHNFDRYLGRKLAPYIDQNFESVKQVEIVEWGGGSMPPETHMIVFGVLELEGKKVLLPLRNRSILTEISKRDTFFRGSGRFSYEAEFDLNDDITKIIKINDFKQMVSSNGCFKIDDFSVDGKIYKFLKENNLQEYCNEVRPFTDINWFLNQREFKDNSDLIFNDPKHRFSNLIRSNVPDIQVPWNDLDIRLAEELLDTIWFNGKIKYLNNGKQVAVSGCVYKFCSQKSFVFVYANNLIGLIQHGGVEFDEDDFLIFSKKHKSLDQLPESFFNAVKEWITETNEILNLKAIDPKVVRFVGSDNKIQITENVFVETNVELERKGWLGVRVGDNDGDGIRVVSTTLAGPADNAGIKTNDIIISLNSNQIKTTKELVEQVSKNKPGEIVDLELIRDGKKKFLKVELGSRNLNKTKIVNKEKNINNKWMFNENSSAVRVEKLGESDLSGTFTYALQKNNNKCDLMTIYFSSMSNGNSDLNELLGLKIPIKINTLGPIEAMIVNIRPAFDINTINNLDLSKEQINKMSSLQNVIIQIGDPRPIDSYDFESVAKKIKIDFVKVDEFDPSKYFSKLSTTWDLNENRTAVENGRSMCGQKKEIIEDKNENLNAIKTTEKALENCADNYFINKTDINEFSQTLYSQNSEIQRLEKETEPLKEKLRSISSQFEIEFKEWEEKNPKPILGVDGELDYETYKRKLNQWNKDSEAAFFTILDNLSDGDHKRLEAVYTKIERLIRSEVAKYVKSKNLTLSNKVKEVDGYLEVYTACEEAYQDTPSSFMLLWSD